MVSHLVRRQNVICWFSQSLYMDKRKMTELRLRIVAYSRRGYYYAVCLDTYNVVRGQSLDEAKRKMADALTLYLKSFSEEELTRREYLRPGPLLYRAMWHFLSLAGAMTNAISSITHFIANYDPHSERLRFA